MSSSCMQIERILAMLSTNRKVKTLSINSTISLFIRLFSKSDSDSEMSLEERLKDLNIFIKLEMILKPVNRNIILK